MLCVYAHKNSIKHNAQAHIKLLIINSLQKPAAGLQYWKLTLVWIYCFLITLDNLVVACYLYKVKWFVHYKTKYTYNITVLQLYKSKIKMQWIWDSTVGKWNTSITAIKYSLQKQKVYGTFRIIFFIVNSSHVFYLYISN